MQATNPDREHDLHLEEWMKRRSDEIRKRYPGHLDYDALTRAQGEIDTLNAQVKAIKAQRADLIARALQAIEESISPRRAQTITTLLELYRRCPTPGEDQHVEADDVLLALIDDKIITELFRAIPKWYA